MTGAMESSMESPAWTHVLVELQNTDDLLFPVKTSARIKYTCISVSRNYIALGSRSGGIYIFHQDTFKYVQLLPGDFSKDGWVTQVSFSHNEEFLAYATSKGLVVTLELNIDRRIKPERVRQSVDHTGCEVTALRWSGDDRRLFMADNMGKVSVIYVTSSKAKGFIVLPSEVIMRLDSAVGQLDYLQNKLVVSTSTKTYLCDTMKQQFTGIGKKPRDGHYGSCFYRITAGDSPMIYCARPGSRIWEVDFEGKVLNTHQLKLLLAIPPMPVVSAKTGCEDYQLPERTSSNPQNISFTVLHPLGDHFLLSRSGNGIYIFDPAKVEVVLWNNEYKDVVMLRCFRNDIYMLHSNSAVTKLSLLQPEELVAAIYSRSQWESCAKLSLAFRNNLLATVARRYVPVDMVTTLRDKLSRVNEDLSLKVQSILDVLQPAESQAGEQSVNYERLESGIYVVKSNSNSFNGTATSTACNDVSEDVLASRGNRPLGNDGGNGNSAELQSLPIDENAISRSDGLLKGATSVQSASVETSIKTTEAHAYPNASAPDSSADIPVGGTASADSNTSGQAEQLPTVSLSTKSDISASTAFVSENAEIAIPCALKSDNKTQLDVRETQGDVSMKEGSSHKRSNGEVSSEPDGLSEESAPVKGTLPRPKSSESLSGPEQTTSSSTNSRRGSLTSMSSSEVPAGIALVDPEPAYAKQEKTPQSRGKKKKVSAPTILPPPQKGQKGVVQERIPSAKRAKAHRKRKKKPILTESEKADNKAADDHSSSAETIKDTEELLLPRLQPPQRGYASSEDAMIAEGTNPERYSSVVTTKVEINRCAAKEQPSEARSVEDVSSEKWFSAAETAESCAGSDLEATLTEVSKVKDMNMNLSSVIDSHPISDAFSNPGDIYNTSLPYKRYGDCAVITGEKENLASSIYAGDSCVSAPVGDQNQRSLKMTTSTYLGQDERKLIAGNNCIVVDGNPDEIIQESLPNQHLKMGTETAPTIEMEQPTFDIYDIHNKENDEIHIDFSKAAEYGGRPNTFGEIAVPSEPVQDIKVESRSLSEKDLSVETTAESSAMSQDSNILKLFPLARNLSLGSLLESSTEVLKSSDLMKSASHLELSKQEEESMEPSRDGGQIDGIFSESPRTAFQAMKDSLASKINKSKSLLLNIKEKRLQLSKKKPDLYVPVSVGDISYPRESQRAHQYGEYLEEEEELAVQSRPLYPAVDTTRLIEATYSARAELEKPEVLYSPPELRKVLSEWVTELHLTLNNLHVAIAKAEKDKLKQQKKGQGNLTEETAGSNDRELQSMEIEGLKIKDTVDGAIMIKEEKSKTIDSKRNGSSQCNPVDLTELSVSTPEEIPQLSDTDNCKDVANEEKGKISRSDDVHNYSTDQSSHDFQENDTAELTYDEKSKEKLKTCDTFTSYDTEDVTTKDEKSKANLPPGDLDMMDEGFLGNKGLAYPQEMTAEIISGFDGNSSDSGYKMSDESEAGTDVENRYSYHNNDAEEPGEVCKSLQGSNVENTVGEVAKIDLSTSANVQQTDTTIVFECGAINNDIEEPGEVCKSLQGTDVENTIGGVAEIDIDLSTGDSVKQTDTTIDVHCDAINESKPPLTSDNGKINSDNALIEFDKDEIDSNILSVDSNDGEIESNNLSVGVDNSKIDSDAVDNSKIDSGAVPNDIAAQTNGKDICDNSAIDAPTLSKDGSTTHVHEELQSFSEIANEKGKHLSVECPMNTAMDTGVIDHSAVNKDANYSGVIDATVIDNGAIENSAIDKDTINNGAIKNGAIDKDTISNSAVENGAVDNGKNDKEAVEDSAVPNERVAIDKNTVDNKAIDKVSTDSGAVGNGEVESCADKIGKEAVESVAVPNDSSAIHKDTVDKVDKVTMNNGAVGNGTINNELQSMIEHEIITDLSSFSNVQYVTDPFGFDDTTLVHITELATLCFETGIHGDISHYLHPADDENCASIQNTPVTKETHHDEVTTDTSIAICDSSMVKSDVVQSNVSVKQINANMGFQSSMRQKNLNDGRDCTDFIQSSSNQSTFDSKYHMANTSVHTAETAQEAKMSSLLFTKIDSAVDLDKELGVFIRCYSFLLEVERMRWALRHMAPPREEMWAAIVQVLQDIGQYDAVGKRLAVKDALSALDLLHSGYPKNKITTLAHVVSLYELIPIKTLKYSAEVPAEISPMDVLYMCQKKDLFKQHFLLYMDLCLENLEDHKSRRSALHDLCEDTEVRDSWLRCLLSSDIHSLQDVLLCVCGYPRPGAHKVAWKRKQLINRILDTKEEGEGGRMAAICKELGYWSGYLHQARGHQSRRLEILGILVQLGDIDLMTDPTLGVGPRSDKEWKTVLQLKEKQYYGDNRHSDLATRGRPHCIMCGKNLGQSEPGDTKGEQCDLTPTITWYEVARSLLENVGVAKGVAMLQQIQIPGGALPYDFFQNCVLAVMVQNQERSVVHSILEKVDTYLWSKRPKCLAPQLALALEEEGESREDDEQSTGIERVMNSTLPCGPFLEEPECHWGISLKVNSDCPCCCLPLSEQFSHLQPGIIIFQCGHSFHKSCLPEKLCALCPTQEIIH